MTTYASERAALEDAQRYELEPGYRWLATEVIDDVGHRIWVLLRVRRNNAAQTDLVQATSDLLGVCERLLAAEEWSTPAERMSNVERADLLRDVIAKARDEMVGLHLIK